MPKFFVEHENVSANKIKITGGDAKHIKKVLRHKIGDLLTICDGRYFDYQCKIVSLQDELVELEIIKSYPLEEPAVKIFLFQAIPKSGKMDMIVEKCVELGAYKIVPVITERTVSRPDDSKKIVRYKKISEAAAKQSLRGIIPDVLDIHTLKEAYLYASSLDFVIIPYENEKHYSMHNFTKEFTGNSIGVFIGPEGGFTKEEICMGSDMGFKSVTLGKRILRTETAGLYALSVIMHELEAE